MMTGHDLDAFVEKMDSLIREAEDPGNLLLKTWIPVRQIFLFLGVAGGKYGFRYLTGYYEGYDPLPKTVWVLKKGSEAEIREFAASSEGKSRIKTAVEILLRGS